MSPDTVVIAAVATRVRQDEADAIDALAFGANRAENLRVLIRYSLEHLDEVGLWLAATDGTPVDDTA